MSKTNKLLKLLLVSFLLIVVSSVIVLQLIHRQTQTVKSELAITPSISVNVKDDSKQSQMTNWNLYQSNKDFPDLDRGFSFKYPPILTIDHADGPGIGDTIFNSKDFILSVSVRKASSSQEAASNYVNGIANKTPGYPNCELLAGCNKSDYPIIKGKILSSGIDTSEILITKNIDNRIIDTYFIESDPPYVVKFDFDYLDEKINYDLKDEILQTFEFSKS